MEVLVNGEWQAVRATYADKPYTYTTKDAAEHAIRTFYPDQLREALLGGKEKVRIREVTDGSLPA